MKRLYVFLNKMRDIVIENDHIIIIVMLFDCDECASSCSYKLKKKYIYKIQRINQDRPMRLQMP